MEKLLVYHLQVAACIVLFYLFYRMLMRTESNFVFRRFYLISASVISFLLPALDFHYTVQSREIPLDYLSLWPVQAIHINTVDQFQANSPLMVFLWIWVIGMGIMLLRLFGSLYYLKRILRQSKPIIDQRLRISQANVQSFSFFKTIVMSPQHYHSKSMKYILAHEQAHTGQYHSMDVFLMEMLKTMQWFNPFAWLLAKEVTQNLEYLADQQVVKSLPNKQAYQMAIVQFAHNSGNTFMRTEFSKSNLKNRIMMMNKSNVQKFHIWKLLLLFPLIGIMLMSFSIKIENLDVKKEVTEMLPIFTESAGNPSIETEMITLLKDSTEQVFTEIDQQPVPVVGLTKYYEEIGQNLKYPKISRKKGIEGKVYVQFVVKKDGTLSEVQVIKGIDKDCDEAALNVVKNGSLWLPGQLNGKPVNTRMILPITFSLGKGEKEETSGSLKGKSDAGMKIQSKGTNEKSPLMILDGNEISSEELAKIDPNSLKSVNVIKDNAAVDEYGEKGKNGVVVIVSKNGMGGTSISSEKSEKVEVSSNPNAVKIRANGQSIDKNNPPLIYKDGEEISLEEMEKIDHNSIKSIEVLKDESAKESYGDKGKNGVILITSK